MNTLRRSLLDGVNTILGQFGLRADTLTARNSELERLKLAAVRGDFDRPLYALPDHVVPEEWGRVISWLPKYSARYETFRKASGNQVGYQFENPYFLSPDAEVLYACVREFEPGHIVEIGCGHSTRIIRQALLDGPIDCHHLAIDPHPREEISHMVDAVMRERIETVDPAELAASLNAGDILFIDTSHEVAPSNDVAYIYGRLLPRIKAGVIVHIHDIFLPYEYPLQWVKDLGLSWGEQYLVQAMLTAGNQWEVLWPGYYLQRTLCDFDAYFPNRREGNAQSLWMRRSGGN